MNQRFFNVFKETAIDGVTYAPKKSYRITRANELTVVELCSKRAAQTTAFEVDFAAIDAAKQTSLSECVPDTTPRTTKAKSANELDEDKGGL